MNEDELQKSIVRVTAGDATATGFVVGPGLILTCFHVVGHAKVCTVSVGSDSIPVEEVTPPPHRDGQPVFDLALLHADLARLPVVELDGTKPTPGDEFYTFGYTDQYQGDSALFIYEGPSREDGNVLYRLKGAQARPGLSGAPLLNRRTMRVIGVVKRTRDKETDLGARAIPIADAIRLAPTLRLSGEGSMRPLPPIDRECFFISPIGDPGSEVRRRSDEVLEKIVKPAAERLNLEPVRADQIHQPGVVTEQIMYHATEARAAVADITNNNPNVIYELGIRAAVPKPVVLIVEKGSDAAPFNIQGLRTIAYDRTDSESVRSCVDEIVGHLTNSYPSSRWEYPTSRLVWSSATRPAIPPGFEIGVRIGRRNLECGILQVEVSGLPSDQGVRTVLGGSGVVHENDPNFRPWSRSKDHFWQAFGGAVTQLVRTAASRGIQVNTIGIAVPGGVLPRQGKFTYAVVGTPFDPLEPIAARLVDFIEKHTADDGMIRDVFRISDVRELRNRIHLDNDARCAARWVACTHAGDPGWRDFCCLFVSSGVGSGLVLDGNVYYGKHDRAGEVGHVTLNLQDELHIHNVVLEKRLCSCGKREFHFESLVGVGGLGYLAQSINAERLDAIRTWIHEHPPSAAAGTIQSGLPFNSGAGAIDQYDESGFVILRALELRSHISPDPTLGAYLRDVVDAYKQIFNVGTGALMDVLDVDRLALCGVIPEVFCQDNELRRSITTPEGLISGGLDVDWGSISEWGWRGAALLSRDSGYMARR